VAIVNFEDIGTPALLIDLDAMERNIQKMSQYFEGKKCCYRPHAKTKSPFIAHKQIRSGARGIACQTLDEAEVMVCAGIPDILTTHMIVTQSKMQRLMRLLKHANIAVTVDNSANVKALGSLARTDEVSLSVIVELNVGQNRTGVGPLKPALTLAREITQTPGLRFKGIMGYEGQLQCTIPNFEERKMKRREALAPLLETKDLLEHVGIHVETVTTGGTGTYNIDSEMLGVTEIQPGSYVVMDGRHKLIETCGRDFECALTILSTVVSRPAPNRAIVDLGWKGCSIEYQIYDWQGMPEPVDVTGVKYGLGGDEHAEVGGFEVDHNNRRPNPIFAQPLRHNDQPLRQILRSQKWRGGANLLNTGETTQVIRSGMGSLIIRWQQHC
jgi:D-serine deaminase-like pyridoxal phosphate-dependent protein